MIREIEEIRDNVPASRVLSRIWVARRQTCIDSRAKAARLKRRVAAVLRLSGCVPQPQYRSHSAHQALQTRPHAARCEESARRVRCPLRPRIESPEYVKELAQHHVGGYLKIAPEALSEGPLSKMMKPGIGAYHRFKEMFDKYSKEAGKEQYLIPYFIAAHPGTTDEDMLDLALWLKKNGFRADQVQAFFRRPWRPRLRCITPARIHSSASRARVKKSASRRG